MALGTTLKLISPRVAGGVSETRTKLTFTLLVHPTAAAASAFGQAAAGTQKAHATKIRKGKAL